MILSQLFLLLLQQNYIILILLDKVYINKFFYYNNNLNCDNISSYFKQNNNKIRAYLIHIIKITNRLQYQIMEI